MLTPDLSESLTSAQSGTPLEAIAETTYTLTVTDSDGDERWEKENQLILCLDTRTGTGACPYMARLSRWDNLGGEVGGPLPSYVSRLTSPVSRNHHNDRPLATTTRISPRGR